MKSPKDLHVSWFNNPTTKTESVMNHTCKLQPSLGHKAECSHTALKGVDDVLSIIAWNNACEEKHLLWGMAETFVTTTHSMAGTEPT